MAEQESSSGWGWLLAIGAAVTAMLVYFGIKKETPAPVVKPVAEVKPGTTPDRPKEEKPKEEKPKEVALSDAEKLYAKLFANQVNNPKEVQRTALSYMPFFTSESDIKSIAPDNLALTPHKVVTHNHTSHLINAGEALSFLEMNGKLYAVHSTSISKEYVPPPKPQTGKGKMFGNLSIIEVKESDFKSGADKVVRWTPPMTRDTNNPNNGWVYLPEGFTLDLTNGGLHSTSKIQIEKQLGIKTALAKEVIFSAAFSEISSATTIAGTFSEILKAKPQFGQMLRKSNKQVENELDTDAQGLLFYSNAKGELIGVRGDIIADSTNTARLSNLEIARFLVNNGKITRLDSWEKRSDVSLDLAQTGGKWLISDTYTINGDTFNRTEEKDFRNLESQLKSASLAETTEKAQQAAKKLMESVKTFGKENEAQILDVVSTALPFLPIRPKPKPISSTP